MKRSSASFWIGLHKDIDQRISLPIFIGLFGIYLVARDSYPLAEAEGSISRYQTHKAVTVCVVSKLP